MSGASVGSSSEIWHPRAISLFCWAPFCSASLIAVSNAPASARNVRSRPMTKFSRLPAGIRRLCVPKTSSGLSS